MFILVTGNPGSGKSYFAVHYMMQHREKYHKIFTNINGFKYSGNIEPLYFDTTLDGSLSFLDHMARLKEIYDEPGTTDDDLLDYLLQVDYVSRSGDDIKPFLVVIDEAHNYFDRKNDLLVWVQSYHRHLYSDFILLTQSSGLIYSSYQKLFEYFVNAVPSSRRGFSRRFRYQKHISVPYRDGKFGTKFEDFTIKHDPKIFDMYKSGDKVRSKSAFTRYLYFVLVAVLLAVGLAYYMYAHIFFPAEEKSSKLSSASSDKRSEVRHVVKSSDVAASPGLSDGDRYLMVRCFAGRCSDQNRRIEFSLSDLPKLLEISSSQYLRKEIRGRHYVVLYLIATRDFFNLFQGASNEKKGFTVFNPFSASGSAR